MSGGNLKVFMGGDICSEGGVEAVAQKLPGLLEELEPDFVIFNGENASGGIGLLPEDAEKLFPAGVDVITGGNHIFEKRESYPLLAEDARVLRPHNYPSGVAQLCPNQVETPGCGFAFYEKNGFKIAVLNIQGREDLMPLDCPFRAAARAADEAAKSGALLFIDFHAESNDEKEAMAFFIDGKACALCGTHTHVQTADERVLPKGTAYITDLGMTGAADSVIGSDIEIVIKRNLTQVLYKMEGGKGALYIQGALVTVDAQSGKAINIERICRKVS